jgi:hypothetical protein
LPSVSGSLRLEPANHFVCCKRTRIKAAQTPLTRSHYRTKCKGSYRGLRRAGQRENFLVFGSLSFSKIQDGQGVLFLSTSSDPQSAGRTKLVYCLIIRQNSAVLAVAVVQCARLTMAGAQDSELVNLTEAADPAQPEHKRAKTLTAFPVCMIRTIPDGHWLHCYGIRHTCRATSGHAFFILCHFVKIGGLRMGHGQNFVRFGSGRTGHVRTFAFCTIPPYG